MCVCKHIYVHIYIMTVLEILCAHRHYQKNVWLRTGECSWKLSGIYIYGSGNCQVCIYMDLEIVRYIYMRNWKLSGIYICGYI